jgi:DNA-binding MarR family transcriptional regulator
MMFPVKKLQMPSDYYDQTPDGNVLATEAVMNTIRTADLLFDQIGRLLRPLNVSAAGGLVLGILRDQGPVSPSGLSDRLIVTRATVTGVLDSLEARGFVHRTANAIDRRGQVVAITPAGVAVLQELRTIVHRHEKAWLGGLSDVDLRGYIERLHRIQDILASASESDG